MEIETKESESTIEPNDRLSMTSIDSDDINDINDIDTDIDTDLYCQNMISLFPIDISYKMYREFWQSYNINNTINIAKFLKIKCIKRFNQILYERDININTSLNTLNTSLIVLDLQTTMIFDYKLKSRLAFDKILKELKRLNNHNLIFNSIDQINSLSFYRNGLIDFIGELNNKYHYDFGIYTKDKLGDRYINIFNVITIEYIIMEGYGYGGDENWIQHLDVIQTHNLMTSAVFVVVSQLRLYGCFQLYKFCYIR